uniref:Uncharacterized protein n=1 Tax=Plectus sambesii TaxID=2011161 RepID=A0A914X8P2_9BILA
MQQQNGIIYTPSEQDERYAKNNTGTRTRYNDDYHATARWGIGVPLRRGAVGRFGRSDHQPLVHRASHSAAPSHAHFDTPHQGRAAAREDLLRHRHIGNAIDTADISHINESDTSDAIDINDNDISDTVEQAPNNGRRIFIIAMQNIGKQPRSPA